MNCADFTSDNQSKEIELPFETKDISLESEFASFNIPVTYKSYIHPNEGT